MIVTRLENSNNSDEVPPGVSIESASYMENNFDGKINESLDEDNNSVRNIEHEEFTPKLFSENLSSETPELTEQLEDDNTEQLFDQEKNEEEDFEIPAFLRRQKF